MNESKTNISYVFFGGEPLGVPVLEELKQANLLPQLIVCNPDRPVGRKQLVTPPPVKVWAKAHGIPVFQPHNFEDQTAILQSNELLAAADVFVVVAYNKILPSWLIDLPPHKTINLHPSLLPKLRGASPIRSALVRDEPESVGVSIIQLDNQMDHGPLLAQLPMQIAPEQWPIAGPELDLGLARMGGALLAATLPDYVAGTITSTPQNHEQATYCGKLDKAMAELQINPNNLPTGSAAHAAYRAYQAFLGIGNAWFIHKDIRYKITAAELRDDQFIIKTVIPAGKTETSFDALI